MIENLWEEIEFDSVEETTGLIEYLQQQGKNLSELTQNIVEGRVVLGHYKTVNPSILSMAQKMTDPSSVMETIMGGGFVYDNEDQVEKEDAGQFYQKNRCKFEIVSQNYKFTVFRLVFGPIYPITIVIDEDIVREEGIRLGIDFSRSKDEEGIRVSSFEELKKCLKSVFSSRKVKYLVKQLMYRQHDGSNNQ